MSKISPPKPNLRQSPSLSFTILHLFIPLVYFTLMTLSSAYMFMGPGIFCRRFEAEISIQSIILFVFIMITFVHSAVRGYTSKSTQFYTRNDKYQCIINLNSAFEAYADVATSSFEVKYPKRAESALRGQKLQFAQYLADPYQTPTTPMSLTMFRRRCQIYRIVGIPMSTLAFASTVFAHYFKDNSMAAIVCMAIWQGVGCGMVVFVCHSCQTGVWTMGWGMKMGGIARQIRRDCLKNGSVKGQEEDIEKAAMNGDPQEMLEWWVGEILKGHEDWDDDSQSRPGGGS